MINIIVDEKNTYRDDVEYPEVEAIKIVRLFGIIIYKSKVISTNLVEEDERKPIGYNIHSDE